MRERLTVIAERCCRDYPGDLVEIGCLNGSTTVLLCAVARLHGRRVVAVDPWKAGTQNCEGGEYVRFMTVTEPYHDLLDVLRLDSRDPRVPEFLKQRGLAFSFVDGLHQYQAALNDILACGHSSLIAVDDITWSTEVKRAWFESAGNLGRLRIEYPALHEAYIL